ncbi:hypothetical protein PspLS_10540 [Pyricularia sp. CBS 133598]|nr:hypothetical protein PspLS_10540 [Pyricularia sp. CBS 133598]
MGREEDPISTTRHLKLLYEMLVEEDFDAITRALDTMAFQQAAWALAREENFEGDHCTGPDDLGSFLDDIPNNIQEVITMQGGTFRFPYFLDVTALRMLINNAINSQNYGTPSYIMLELIREVVANYILGCMKQSQECPEDASWPDNVPPGIISDVMTRIMVRIYLGLFIAQRNWYEMLELD